MPRRLRPETSPRILRMYAESEPLPHDETLTPLRGEREDLEILTQQLRDYIAKTSTKGHKAGYHAANRRTFPGRVKRLLSQTSFSQVILEDRQELNRMIDMALQQLNGSQVEVRLFTPRHHNLPNPHEAVLLFKLSPPSRDETPDDER